jgi:hypothetical protein
LTNRGVIVWTVPQDSKHDSHFIRQEPVITAIKTQ